MARPEFHYLRTLKASKSGSTSNIPLPLLKADPVSQYEVGKYIINRRGPRAFFAPPYGFYSNFMDERHPQHVPRRR